MTMKKLLQLSVLLIIGFALVGCSSGETLEDFDLDGMTGKEILTGIADGTIEPDGYAVSVYDHELLVLTEKDSISVAMPEDEFYLSVAPYKTVTHECTYHSATGCRGELKNETVFVEYILTDGTIVLSEEMTIMSNGFIDLWLPRDIEGTLTITQGELSASKVISTTTGDPTCETTMKLT